MKCNNNKEKRFGIFNRKIIMDYYKNMLLPNYQIHQICPIAVARRPINPTFAKKNKPNEATWL